MEINDLLILMHIHMHIPSPVNFSSYFLVLVKDSDSVVMFPSDFIYNWQRVCIHNHPAILIGNCRMSPCSTQSSYYSVFWLSLCIHSFPCFCANCYFGMQLELLLESLGWLRIASMQLERTRRAEVPVYYLILLDMMEKAA